MASSSGSAPDIGTSQDTTSKEADATVSRADETHLRDDRDAKARFLETFSAAEGAAIMKKVDRRFFVLIGLMYMIKQIDTNNAANVKVLQVGEPSNVITELVFETPSNLLLKRMSPHVWQARIFLCWGIIVACHAAVQNRQGLYALRFLLGTFEAGMFPGVMVQLSAWYRTDEMARPVAWFFTIQNFANIVGSLLCYGISYINGAGGLSAWRWVYLIEGIFTIFFSGAVFYILPDYPKSPRSNRWLTPREQEFIEVRLPENAPLTSDPFFSKKEIIVSLKSPLIWFIMTGMVICFVLFFTLTSKIGIYIACVLGTMFTSVYFIPFWAWRSATLRGSTGAAFTLGFQNAIGQVGTVTAPQLFQQKWAYDGYKQSFAIAAAGTVAAFFANLWTWWLTRNTEYDVMRVRRLIRRAKKEGKVFNGDDVKIFEQRRFFGGLRKRTEAEVLAV
ncbi:hypothetical protein SLS62_010036 [Diatrype stigma]|uniref:Major facilitator superfamily (MFS) profile domain-containing protein n=1 Tax=Diatrype stigma TaxID=117547 RepID=A0AAN9UJZ4_9PEZI